MKNQVKMYIKNTDRSWVAEEFDWLAPQEEILLSRYHTPQADKERIEREYQAEELNF